MQQFRCELISWVTLHNLAHDLAVQIRRAGFNPDIVVAIARGGVVPARLLCDFLDLTDLRTIRIAHYTAGAHKRPTAKLVQGLGRKLDRQKILLVDDISDTGDTLALARTHLAEQNAGPVRLAVLHHKQTSTVVPDFYAHRIIKWRWIIYPWAVTEDITGFIARMDPPPGETDAAVHRLRKMYGLSLPRPLIEKILMHGNWNKEKHC